MRPGCARRQIIEVQPESAIQNEIVLRHLCHVDLAITIRLDPSYRLVFMEEVITDHEALLVGCESQKMWTRIRSEIEEFQQAWLRWCGRVKHRHFAGEMEGQKQALAIAGHLHQLRPAALG